MYELGKSFKLLVGYQSEICLLVLFFLLLSLISWPLDHGWCDYCDYNIISISQFNQSANHSYTVVQRQKAVSVYFTQ